jgi:hypothetical protein
LRRYGDGSQGVQAGYGSEPPEACERPVELATFRQMAQISVESLARRAARTEG